MAKIIKISYEKETHDPEIYVLNFDEPVISEDIPKILTERLCEWNDSDGSLYEISTTTEGIISVTKDGCEVANYDCRHNGVGNLYGSFSITEHRKEDFPCLPRIFKEVGIKREIYSLSDDISEIATTLN